MSELLNSLRNVRDRGGYDWDDAQDRALFRQALRRSTENTKVAALKDAQVELAPNSFKYRDRDGTTYQLAEHLMDEVR